MKLIIFGLIAILSYAVVDVYADNSAIEHGADCIVAANDNCKTLGSGGTVVCKTLATKTYTGGNTGTCVCEDGKYKKDTTDGCVAQLSYDAVCTDTTDALNECKTAESLKCKVRSADDSKKCSKDLAEGSGGCTVREDCATASLACYGTTLTCQTAKAKGEACKDKKECQTGLTCTNDKCSGATVLKTSALTFLIIAIMSTFFKSG